MNIESTERILNIYALEFSKHKIYQRRNFIKFRNLYIFSQLLQRYQLYRLLQHIVTKLSTVSCFFYGMFLHNSCCSCNPGFTLSPPKSLTGSCGRYWAFNCGLVEVSCSAVTTCKLFPYMCFLQMVCVIWLQTDLEEEGAPCEAVA